MLEPLVGQSGKVLRGRGEPFFEIQTLHGVVDLLFVRFDEVEIGTRAGLALPAIPEVAAVATLRALSRLSVRSGHDIGFNATAVAAAAGYSPDHLRRRVLPYLAAGGWVVRDGSSWRTTRNYREPVLTVVAVELKLREWRRALRQAIAHQESVDASYVALDAGSLTDASSLNGPFQFAGIGLLTVDAAPERSGRGSFAVRRLIKASHKKAARLARAVLSERVVALKMDGRRSGDVTHVFGKYLHPTNGCDPRFGQAAS